MEIYLIRHTTPKVVKGMIYGRTEVDLTNNFEQEKKIILQKLPEALDQVYSSPSKRCSLLANSISSLYCTDQRLYEVNFGLWEKQNWDTVNQDELKAWMEDFVNVAPPGGESMIEMQSRVLNFWMELQQKQFSKVAVVTHAGVIRLILAFLKNIPLEKAFEVKVNYSDTFMLTKMQTAEVSILKL